MRMRYRASIARINTNEELDFFIFTADEKVYESAMEILKQRDPSLYFGLTGRSYGPERSNERLFLTIEKTPWEIMGVDHVAIAVDDGERMAQNYELLGAKTSLVTADSKPS